MFGSTLSIREKAEKNVEYAKCKYNWYLYCTQKVLIER
jgi:hypothetical protein